MRSAALLAGPTGSKRTNDRIRVRAGCTLRPGEKLADRVRRGPGRPTGRRSAPYPAGADQNIGRKSRIQQPRRVDEASSSPATCAGPIVGAPDKVRGSACCATGALPNTDTRTGRDIPQQRIALVDGHRATLARRELRPRRSSRRRPSSGNTVRAQPHQQRTSISRMLREADDLGKRPQAAIQILKVCRIIRRAGSPPADSRHPSIATDRHRCQDKQRLSRCRQHGNGMLGGRNLRGRSTSIHRIGRVAKQTPCSQGTAIEIDRARIQQRVLRRTALYWHRRERKDCNQLAESQCCHSRSPKETMAVGCRR